MIIVRRTQDEWAPSISEYAKRYMCFALNVLKLFISFSIVRCHWSQQLKKSIFSFHKPHDTISVAIDVDRVFCNLTCICHYNWWIFNLVKEKLINCHISRAKTDNSSAALLLVTNLIIKWKRCFVSRDRNKLQIC